MTIANGQPAKMKRAFELLAAAEHLHDSSELQAPLITNVIDTLTEAIELFAAFDDGLQRTDWQALCQIASARALYLRAFLKGDHSGVSSAIDSARKGLELISTQTHPQDCIDAYLLMATGLQQLATTGLCSDPGNQQFQALTALQAADYLSLKGNMLQKRAGVLRDKAIFLETYFYDNRDNNLGDAIRCAKLAIQAYGKTKSANTSKDVPKLFNLLGNCFLKMHGNRSKVIKQAQQAYAEGLAAVDTVKWPQLKQVLQSNLDMARGLIAAKDYNLPEDEMVSRFSVKIKETVESGDMQTGLNWAWEFLRWGWQHPQTPNVHIAYAHESIGNIYHALQQYGTAADHLYSAQVVLWGTVPQEHAYFQGMEKMQAVYTDCLARIGLAEQAPQNKKQARSALKFASTERERAIQWVDDNPDKALEAFNNVLTAYPHEPLSLFYRGSLYMNKQVFDLALADFDLALKLNPESIGTRVNRGNLKLITGDTQGALSDFTAALKLDETNIPALWGKCIVLNQQEKWMEALAGIEAYLKITSQDEKAYLLGARCYQKMNMKDEALDLLERGRLKITDEKRKTKLQELSLPIT